MREFRFAIGDPFRLRSTVWLLKSTKADFYIHSRMMGGSTKVSIHESGQAQWSMQAEWYGKNRPSQPNAMRHIEKWTWTAPNPNTATHTFRIFIPRTELRTFTTSEDLSLVTWLPDPGLGKQVVIETYISPSSAADAPSKDAGFLCALERDHGTSVVAFARIADMSEHDNEQLAQVHAEVAQVVATQDLTVKPGYRVVAFAVDDNGIRGMIELVPDGA